MIQEVLLWGEVVRSVVEERVSALTHICEVVLLLQVIRFIPCNFVLTLEVFLEMRVSVSVIGLVWINYNVFVALSDL